MKRSKKILIYKLSCFLFAIVLLLLPQRALPQSDIQVLATVLGIDGTGGNVTVAAQLAVPVAQSGDGKASTVAKATGGSISEALENLEIGMGRRVNFGHLSTVAAGKGMLLSDIKEFVSYLMSSGKVGPGAYLVYCSHSTASEFIEQAQKMGESSDAELGNFIAYNKSGNHVTTATALKFLQTLHSTSGAACLPCVQLEDENSESNPGDSSVGEGRGGAASEKSQSGAGGLPTESEKKQEEQKSEEAEKSGRSEGESESESQAKSESGGNSENGSQQEGGGSGKSSDGKKSGKETGTAEKKKLVAADSIAVYGGDREEPTVLNALATRGVVWQDTHSNYGLVELRNVLIDGQTVPSVAARLSGKSVKKSAKIVKGENVLTYKIKVKLKLDDSHICANPGFFGLLKDKLEEEFESVIRNNLAFAVQTSKETGIDFLGIREWFHKFCRKGAENFDLSSVIVNIETKVIIQT